MLAREPHVRTIQIIVGNVGKKTDLRAIIGNINWQEWKYTAYASFLILPYNQRLRELLGTLVKK